MEPISAFSLACNVIQVVDFGFRLAAGCREMYHSGSLATNDDIEQIATSLEGISQDIEMQTASAPASDSELGSLAVKAAATSTALLSELASIKISGQKRRRSALGKTFKAMWKRSTIDDLQKQLDSYQKALEFRMLKNLCDKFDIAALQQKNSFASLDQNMQSIIQRLAAGHTKIADLVSWEGRETRVHVTKDGQSTRSVVAQDGEETRRHVVDVAEASRANIANEFASLSMTQADTSHCKAVMDSLFFPDLHVRQESIKEAHKNTFKWIFKDDAPQTRPWSNFISWLKDGHGIYWISGKAGSGKSTLMNYICTDERTRTALRIWAGNRELVYPTFFFWNAGSTLQKSARGLLRSLLYQILEIRPSLTSTISQGPIATWTEARLSKTLLSLVRGSLQNESICVFIDGLDEFEGAQEDLLSLIYSLEQHSNVKICVSSRPLQAFQQSFRSSSRLKLEVLTRKDISFLVNDKLSSTSAAGLAEQLVGRADGVFLWVDLAVKDLLRGVDNEDSYFELETRLRLIPQEIDDLYLHMLNRIDTIYHDSARMFLRLLIDHTRTSSESMSLLDFALATYNGLDVMLASPFQEEFRESDLRNLVLACRRLKKQIAVRCAGLLEVGDTSDEGRTATEDMNPDRSIAYVDLLQFKERSRVDFIHRSAYDFFHTNKQGIAFLDSTPSIDTNMAEQLWKAELVALRFLPRGLTFDGFTLQIEFIVRLAKDIDRLADDPCEMLLETTDSWLANIKHGCDGGVYAGPGSLQHWYVHDSYNYIFIPSRLASVTGFHTSEPEGLLGFAAWNSLSAYILKKLDQLPKLEVMDTASYALLLCLSNSDFVTQQKVNFMRKLFSYGASGGFVFKVPLQTSKGHRQDDDNFHCMTSWKVYLDLLAKIIVDEANPLFDQWACEKSRILLPLLEQFLNQRIDPGTVAEVVVSFNGRDDDDDLVDWKCALSTEGWAKYALSTEDWAKCALSTEGWAKWISTDGDLFPRRLHSFVVSMSPATVVSHLHGCSTDMLPSEMRDIKTRRVIQVGREGTKRFLNISDTQAEYLTDAFDSWLASRDSKPTRSTLYSRFVEVLDEVDPPSDEGKDEVDPVRDDDDDYDERDKESNDLSLVSAT